MTTVESRLIVNEVGKQLKRQQLAADEGLHKAQAELMRPIYELRVGDRTPTWIEIAQVSQSIHKDPRRRMEKANSKRKAGAELKKKIKKGIDIEHLGMMDKTTRANMQRTFYPMPNPSA